VKTDCIGGSERTVKDLPINSRIVEQLSKATVKTLVDGIVELVTNSDDSYKRLEERGKPTNGIVDICASRKKGGIADRLVVKDFAEGMTREELEKALEFGGETSGFSTGKTVRGFFGRGLKETIIALGEGEITSMKNGKLCRTRVWFDRKAKKPQYDDDILNSVESTSDPDGTEISIRITNYGIRIAEFKNFGDQLSKHYALRDINSSSSRNIALHFNDMKRRQVHNCRIAFSYPESTNVLEKELQMAVYGDPVKLALYESIVPLESPRNTPYGLAGILIKTKGAILDNRLFKFENDTAALYFFGEAICEGLEERLRKGESELIDFNRGGLEWSHEYCKCLETEIERALEPFILAKKKALERAPEKQLREPTRKMLRKLCTLLNELARKELEDFDELPVDPEPDISDLVLKPEWVNVQREKPRTLSVYAPNEVVQTEGDKVDIESDTASIQPQETKITLEKHPKYPERMSYSYFKIVGSVDDAEGVVTATLGSRKAIARVKVSPPKTREKGQPTGSKGGFISDIRPDEEESPPQRTFYDKNTGVIKIFIKFPSVTGIIGSGLEGAETPEGRILLSELVGEAFCRELARRRIEMNPPIPGSEIDAFNDEMNKIQRRILEPIQQIVREWRFSL
jgi:hypothetical protein